MPKEEIQTIDEIAAACFDEAGIQDGDEGTYNPQDYTKPLSADADSSGEQDEASKAVQDGKGVETGAPERLYAGKFKTPEEMEAAFLEIQKPAQPEKKEDAIPDLSREELTTLSENDDMDKTSYTVEYLRKKMSERDLSDFELEKLRELDGKDDLYGQYVAAKTERQIMAKLKPVVDTVSEESNRKAQEEFFKRESAIEDSNKEEFGDELPTLKKKVSDPKFIEEVLSQSPIRNVILNEWDKGSKAMSHKLLLRETKYYVEQQKNKKINKSVQADIGGGAAQRKTNSASTIDEAFEAAEREFHQ
jgi:hypothetical protein